MSGQESPYGETTTDDPDVFRDRWNRYIEHLESLKASLPGEQFDELDDAMADLRALVEDAAEEFEEAKDDD